MSETGTMRVHRIVGGEKIFSSEWAHDKLHNLRAVNYPEALLALHSKAKLQLWPQCQGL